ncbi:MAG: M1 family peptidase [Balneolaceae bacterium]|nr:MAG: M1 family peptidase [Balneolaceae bacterium]
MKLSPTPLRIIPLILAIFTVSCSSSEPVTSIPDSIAGSVLFKPERPIPYPLDVPQAFEAAVTTGTRTATGEPGPKYWQNFASYNLHALLDPETDQIRGRASIRYQNNSPDDLEMIVFELAQNLHKKGTPKMDVTEITGGITLYSISVNSNEVNEISMADRWLRGASGYISEGTQLYLFPEEPLLSGEEMEFEFEWSFTIPENGASGRMGRSRENLYFVAYWYPHLSVYDDVYGWFTDPFLGNAEFYHGFADYNLTVTAPREWLIMGTGEFMNPEEVLSEVYLERYNSAKSSDDPVLIADFDEGHKVTQPSGQGLVSWIFSAEKVRDVAFSATLASRWESARTPVGDLTGDGKIDYTRIHTFYRESAPLWTSQTAYAQHSITFLSDYTSVPYPWPHMTSVEGAGIIGGGMEFPMITIIGDYNTAGAERLYGVTAHELAHMWIPMLVSSNERRYSWIDEGYTSFHTNEANIDYFGADRYNSNSVFSRYLQIAGTDFEGEMMRWSDFHYPGPAFGIASYPKPASVLYALRGVIGEELFMKAHLEFIQRWLYKHPYPWDIFNTIEDVTGLDLSWFWRAWYYETWTLDQAVADVTINGNRTEILIKDLGNVPMPVHLLISFSDGSEKKAVLDVEPWLNGHRRQKLQIDSGSGVTRVEIDPDYLFPDIDRDNNVWQR